MPKRSDPPPTITGTIRSLHEKGFGFIVGDDGTEYFFHRSAAEEYDTLGLGMAVRFTRSEGPKGPRAEQVRKL